MTKGQAALNGLAITTALALSGQDARASFSCQDNPGCPFDNQCSGETAVPEGTCRIECMVWNPTCQIPGLPPGCWEDSGHAHCSNS